MQNNAVSLNRCRPRKMLFFLLLFGHLFFGLMAIPTIEFISLLPDAPIAPGLRIVGAALDLAMEKLSEKYGGDLNVTLIKSNSTGEYCEDIDGGTVDFAANLFYRSNRSSSCMAFIGSGLGFCFCKKKQTRFFLAAESLQIWLWNAGVFSGCEVSTQVNSKSTDWFLFCNAATYCAFQSGTSSISQCKCSCGSSGCELFVQVVVQEFRGRGLIIDYKNYRTQRTQQKKKIWFGSLCQFSKTKGSTKFFVTSEIAERVLETTENL